MHREKRCTRSYKPYQLPITPTSPKTFEYPIKETNSNIHPLAITMHDFLEANKITLPSLEFTSLLIQKSRVSSQIVIQAAHYLISTASNETREAKLVLLVAALNLATKMLDDNAFTCKSWALISNVKAAWIVQGEMILLKRLKYQIGISSQEFRILEYKFYEAYLRWSVLVVSLPTPKLYP